MPLRLYDSFSKKERELVTLEPGKVRMYTCGPTVYGRPHIGNYSSFLMADLLRRWLEVSGYQVKHVKNITDVGHLLHDADSGDDKIQKEADKEKLHPLEIAKRYTAEYLEDEKALNMLEPFKRPRASDYVPQMIAIIKTLLEKGNAYDTEDGIYFAVETFPKYGQLSGNTLQNLNAGARIAVDEKKKHPADFALWKKCVGDNGRHVLRWNFATGKISETSGEDAQSGFPGWHIECSAMSSDLLGEQIDIHTGGEDNIFPHHECEIAQSEAAFGKPFVGLWLHKRRIDLAGTKMSKSLGNVLTLPGIVEKGYSPQDLRYYLLSVHYRTNLKFTWKGMDDARKARSKVAEWIHRKGYGEFAAGTDSKAVELQEITELENEFKSAMDSDLNTPGALGAVFKCITYVNAKAMPIDEARDSLDRFVNVIRNTFGCFESEEASAIPSHVQALIDERKAARAHKDFKESDRLRDLIKEKGYEVKDRGEEQHVNKL